MTVTTSLPVSVAPELCWPYLIWCPYLMEALLRDHTPSIGTCIQGRITRISAFCCCCETASIVSS